MSTDLCLTAACFDVALLATLVALFVFLGAVLDLVVGAAAAITQLTLGALRNRMANFATIETALLTWGTLFVAFFLLATATNSFDMALFTALRTLIILLGAVFPGMVGAAAAFAHLRFRAVRHSVAGFTTIVTLPLLGFPLRRLVARAALFGDVALLATLLAFLIFLGAFLDLVICAAAAFAQLWRCAICHSMICFAAIEAALLARLASLLLCPELRAGFVLVTRTSTSGLTAYFRKVPDLATI